MKKPDENNANNPSETITDINPNSGPASSSLQYARPEYARDTYHAISQKPGKKRNYAIKPARGYSQDVTARGDDYLVIQKQGRRRIQAQQQQQPQGMASADAMKGKWKQQVGAAKVMWGKLTDDELLKSEGHAQKLAGLVQERYAVTRDEADKQVRKFMDSRR